MNGAVVLPDPVMQRIERLKTGPEDTPVDVITRLLDYYDDDIDEDLERRILKGLEDADAGRHRPLRDIAKEMGIWLPYRVDFSDYAEEDLKRLPHDVAEGIKNKILSLETVKNPRKYLEKVAGKFDGRVYRYRIGNFRAYLTFKDEKLVIVVIEVGYRKNIYKNWVFGLSIFSCISIMGIPFDWPT